MADVKRLDVDLDNLTLALEDATENRWFLDLQTGEFLLLAGVYSPGDRRYDEPAQRIHAEPRRYAEVPKQGRWVGRGDMEDFVYTLGNNPVVEVLIPALEGRGGFRRFTDVLLRHDDIRERWFAFHERRLQDRAFMWLRSVGVDPMLLG